MARGLRARVGRRSHACRAGARSPTALRIARIQPATLAMAPLMAEAVLGTAAALEAAVVQGGPVPAPVALAAWAARAGAVAPARPEEPGARHRHHRPGCATTRPSRSLALLRLRRPAATRSSAASGCGRPA